MDFNSFGPYDAVTDYATTNSFVSVTWQGESSSVKNIKDTVVGTLYLYETGGVNGFDWQYLIEDVVIDSGSVAAGASTFVKIHGIIGFEFKLQLKSTVADSSADVDGKVRFK